MDLNTSETTRPSGGDDNQEQTFSKSSSSIQDEIPVEKLSSEHAHCEAFAAEHSQIPANISDRNSSDEHARNVEQNFPEKTSTTKGEHKSRLSEQIKKMDLIKAHFHKEDGRYSNIKPHETVLCHQADNQEAKGVEEYQVHVNSSQASSHGDKIVDETSRKRKIDSLETIIGVCKQSKEEKKQSSEDLSRNYLKDKKSNIHSTNEYIETEDCCIKEDRSESKANIRKMNNDVNGVQSTVEEELRCLGDSLKEDDINNDSGGFGVEEMQSQRCVMAFNTYGSTSGDHKGNHRETILDVNINEISTDKQRVKRNCTSNHMILDNIEDRLDLRKRDIKVASTMDEMLTQMKEEPASAGTSPSTEVNGPSNEASDGKFLVGGDGDGDVDIGGDREEEIGTDLEQLVSLYFDQQVIYTCEECEFETETKVSLVCHYSANHSEDHRLDSMERLSGRWYQCGLCIFKARYMKNLRLHYKFRHGYHGELYQCCHPACNHVAQFKEDLLQHYRACHVYTATALLVNRTQ